MFYVNWSSFRVFLRPFIHLMSSEISLGTYKYSLKATRIKNVLFCFFRNFSCDRLGGKKRISIFVTSTNMNDDSNTNHSLGKATCCKIVWYVTSTKRKRNYLVAEDRLNIVQVKLKPS